MKDFSDAAYRATFLGYDTTRASMRCDTIMVEQAQRSMAILLDCWPCDLPDLRTPEERRADFWFKEGRNEDLGLDAGEFTPLDGGEG